MCIYGDNNWPFHKICILWHNYRGLELCLQAVTTTTRKHPSMMHTTCLPTVHALVATRCQYLGGSSSDQVWTGLRSWLPDVTGGCPYTVRSHVQRECWGWGSLYGELQCITANGHMGEPPCRQTDTIENIPAAPSAGVNNDASNKYDHKCRLTLTSQISQKGSLWTQFVPSVFLHRNSQS